MNFCNLIEVTTIHSGIQLYHCITMPCFIFILLVTFSESKWHVCFDQLVIGERIGEGQFGDVHTGIMDSNVKVAIKSCKAASTIEEKHKFMREAGTA